MKATLLARTYEKGAIDDLKNKPIYTAIKVLNGGKELTEAQRAELERLETVNHSFNNIDELRLLGGKLAGICYMPDDYLSGEIQNTVKANSRANMTTKSGHHSVFDHGNMTILFEGLPKIVAMLLNSTEFYTTSEKSARYTAMKPETELETEVYEKWVTILTDVIKEEYPNTDDKLAHKLAQENARYMISVFTPTVMAYTTSHRQLNYLVDWCDKLIADLAELDGAFNKKLKESVIELRDCIIGVLGEKTITDNKNRHFEFMPVQHGIDEADVLGAEEVGETYSISYRMTFAALAQAQRHRTIHYEMIFNGDNADEFGFFVPDIIKDRESLLNAWLIDMRSVAYCYPQGTLVVVKEQGLTKDFFLKCKERMCGRAQLEIMQNTAESLKLFINNKDRMSNTNKNELDGMIENGIVPKCGFKGYKCLEPCAWGIKGGLTRRI